MEGKKYSLRSRRSDLSSDQQTKLNFPCRRNGRSTGKRRPTDKRASENESPPKRTRVAGTVVFTETPVSVTGVDGVGYYHLSC